MTIYYISPEQPYLETIAEKYISLKDKNYSIYFEDFKTSEIISRLINDISLVSNIIAGILSYSLRNSLMAIGSIIMMFNISIKLTLIMSCTILALIPFVVIFGKKIKLLAHSSQNKIATLTANIEETFNAIKTIQSFNYEAAKILDLNESAAALLKSNFERLKYRSFFFSVVILAIITITTFTLRLGIEYIDKGYINSGQLIAFIYFAIQTSLSIAGMSDIYSEVQRAIAALERVMILLPNDFDAINILNDNVKHKIKNYDIVFDKISFSYPNDSSRLLLQNFNLTVKQGESLAIVGKSGIGKTTIFQLLLGFNDYQSGDISIGGNSYKNVDQKQIRDLIAYVPQEPFIFSTTIKENLLIGNPSASLKEMDDAMVVAGLDEFINSLPLKYDSFVGEKGVRLSGGQKQRLAIARALLKNAQILLLDEATSALDSINENKILHSLKEFISDKTLIVIAHRITTIKDYNRIVVVEDGRVSADGDYNELLQSSNYFIKVNQINNKVF